MPTTPGSVNLEILTDFDYHEKVDLLLPNRAERNVFGMQGSLLLKRA